MNKIYISIILNIMFLGLMNGQGIHFTQYELSPTIVNPAYTGQFSGTYRVNGVYRDQYRTIGNEPFGTYSATVDVPIIRGLRKQDWIGGGINLRSSTDGTIGLKRSSFGLNLGYHLSLDKKQMNILSLGVQFSSGSLSTNRINVDDTSGGIVNSQFGATAGNYNGNTQATDPVDNGSLSDLQVGLLYNIRGKKGLTDFKIGVAVDGLLSPDRGKTPNLDEKSLGINGIVSYTQPMNKRTYLEHGLFFYSQDGASAWNLNSRANYQLKPDKDLYLVAGLGTRSARSVLFYTGVKKGPWKVGLAYDLDIGGSTEGTGNHKAIELGVTYLGIINKRPEPDPIIYCPRI